MSIATAAVFQRVLISVNQSCEACSRASAGFQFVLDLHNLTEHLLDGENNWRLVCNGIVIAFFVR